MVKVIIGVAVLSPLIANDNGGHSDYENDE